MIGKHFAYDLRDFADLRPGHAAHRIEIDTQFIRVFKIVDAYRMRMQLETAEIGHPRERRRFVRDDFLGTAPGRETQLYGVQPSRSIVRRSFLEEVITVDSVRIAHHHVGPCRRHPADAPLATAR